MSRNKKLAEQLVRLAKALAAQDAEPNPEGEAEIDKLFNEEIQEEADVLEESTDWDVESEPDFSDQNTKMSFVARELVGLATDIMAAQGDDIEEAIGEIDKQYEEIVNDEDEAISESTGLSASENEGNDEMAKALIQMAQSLVSSEAKRGRKSKNEKIANLTNALSRIQRELKSLI